MTVSDRPSEIGGTAITFVYFLRLARAGVQDQVLAPTRRNSSSLVSYACEALEDDQIPLRKLQRAVGAAWALLTSMNEFVKQYSRARALKAQKASEEAHNTLAQLTLSGWTSVRVNGEYGALYKLRLLQPHESAAYNGNGHNVSCFARDESLRILMQPLTASAGVFAASHTIPGIRC